MDSLLRSGYMGYPRCSPRRGVGCKLSFVGDLASCFCSKVCALLKGDGVDSGFV